MNRIIRFRAWDKKEKLMCPVKITNWGKGCFLEGNSPTPEEWVKGTRIIVAEVKEGHFVNWGDLELMQYTGLKDKNGKEIYEGDLVSVEEHYPASGGKWTPQVATVSFENGKFVIRSKNGLYGTLSDYAKISEVIGNIYENSELINQKTQTP